MGRPSKKPTDPLEIAQLIKDAQAGISTRELGDRYGVTPAAIRSWLKQWREQGLRDTSHVRVIPAVPGPNDDTLPRGAARGPAPVVLPETVEELEEQGVPTAVARRAIYGPQEGEPEGLPTRGAARGRAVEYMKIRLAIDNSTPRFVAQLVKQAQQMRTDDRSVYPGMAPNVLPAAGGNPSSVATPNTQPNGGGFRRPTIVDRNTA